jgi:site-specific DNA recombinase
MRVGMMRAAVYARVSSEQQAKQTTIASQLAALRARVAADELLLEPDHCFVDEGHSGSTLLRPALERLRDAAYAGTVDRLYVHAPDRLARKYAYQVLLMEELQRQGVEVVFLNQPLGQTAEEQLLVQVQGMIAEYERATIMERSRRGKRHAAQQGRVSVLGQAPYGYRYLSRHEPGGARYVVLTDQAAVVRQIFHWIGQERLPLREAVRRLGHDAVPSPSGQARWSPGMVSRLVKNSAYRGQAIFGRQAQAQEQIVIPVPALVSEELFAAAQEQMEENRRRYRQRRRSEPHLLQGLLVCQCCGRAFCHSRCASRRKPQVYRYYRCTSMMMEGRRQRTCVNSSMPASALEEAVWQDVCALLREPRRLAAEFQRRCDQPAPPAETLAWLQQQQAKEKRALGRLIDAYENGLLNKEELAPRLERTRQRLQQWQTQAQEFLETQARERDLDHAVGRLEDFAQRIDAGLRQPTPTQKREILKALIKRVEIAPEKIRVIYKIHPLPKLGNEEVGSLQHCPSRVCALCETTDFHQRSIEQPRQRPGASIAD